MNKLIATILLLLISSLVYTQTWHKPDQPLGANIIGIDVSSIDSNKIVIAAHNGTYINYDIVYSDEHILKFPSLY